jgi:hypothetical protein
LPGDLRCNQSALCRIPYGPWQAHGAELLPRDLLLLQKKCPTCRKSMQVRQIHKVFVNFS